MNPKPNEKSAINFKLFKLNRLNLKEPNYVNYNSLNKEKSV